MKSKITSKKQLAILLSKLADFWHPSPLLEQYSTHSEIASEIIWLAYLNGDIKGKNVLDQGCGTGILAIASRLMGANYVVGFDIDKSAVRQATKNLEKMNLDNVHFISCVAEFLPIDSKFDTIVQNPPFGIQKKHADLIFWVNAFRLGNKIYSFFKWHEKTYKYIKNLTAKNSFKISDLICINFPIKHTFYFHQKKVANIRVAIVKADKL